MLTIFPVSSTHAKALWEKAQDTSPTKTSTAKRSLAIDGSSSSWWCRNAKGLAFYIRGDILSCSVLAFSLDYSDDSHRLVSCSARDKGYRSANLGWVWYLFTFSFSVYLSWTCPKHCTPLRVFPKILPLLFSSLRAFLSVAPRFSLLHFFSTTQVNT